MISTLFTVFHFEEEDTPLGLTKEAEHYLYVLPSTRGNILFRCMQEASPEFTAEMYETGFSRLYIKPASVKKEFPQLSGTHCALIGREVYPMLGIYSPVAPLAKIANPFDPTSYLLYIPSPHTRNNWYRDSLSRKATGEALIELYNIGLRRHNFKQKGS